MIKRILLWYKCKQINKQFHEVNRINNIHNEFDAIFLMNGLGERRLQVAFRRDYYHKSDLVRFSWYKRFGKPWKQYSSNYISEAEKIDHYDTYYVHTGSIFKKTVHMKEYINGEEIFNYGD